MPDFNAQLLKNSEHFTLEYLDSRDNNWYTYGPAGNKYKWEEAERRRDAAAAKYKQFQYRILRVTTMVESVTAR